MKAGITKPGTGITDIGALILEIVFTAGFIARDPRLDQARARPGAAGHPARRWSPIHFATATLSGASVNPARSIGSAVVGGD